MPGLPRYVLMPVGYVAGCIAAAFVIVFAIGGLASEPGETAPHLATQLVIAIAAYTAAFAFLPMVIAAIVVEISGWHSLAIWLAIGALIGLFALATIGRFMPGISVERPWLFFASGMVLGLVYWAIAGRLGSRGAELT